MIAGDRNVAGRLYAAASGQGVVFGDATTQQLSCDNTEQTMDGEFNLINNPTIPSWTQSNTNNASMTGTINAYTKAVLDITNPGANNWDLQLWQDDLTMQADKVYLLQTDLRSDDTRTVTLKLRNKTDGHVYFEKDIDVHSTSEEHSFLISSDIDDDDLRLTLQVGGQSETVYVDHLRLREFCTEDIAAIDCTNVIELLDHNILANTYQAQDEVISTGLVMSQDAVMFKASESVLLDPGFTADIGAELQVIMQGCP